MAEFINIYAGALVALSSLRNQTGASGKIPQHPETGRGPAEAGGPVPVAARPDIALQP